MKIGGLSTRVTLLYGVALALSACGEGSPGTQPITTIPPTGTPTPSPTTTPTPSPTPTPAGPVIGQAGVGDTMRGPLVCGQAGTLSFGPPSNGLENIISLASIFIATDISVVYNAADTYTMTIGGSVPASNPKPAIKRTSTTGVYDYFREGTGEFEIYRNAASPKLANVTIGRVSDNSRVCFFGLGGPAAYARPSGLSTKDFTGIADGIAMEGGTNYRLFGSATTARVDYVSARVDIRIEFRGYESAFGHFLDAPRSDTRVATGTATLGTNGIFEGTVTSADGYTGPVRGQLYGATAGGLTMAYALRKSTTDVAFGMAGLDAN